LRPLSSAGEDGNGALYANVRSQLR
jgi:hypothetical protein